MDITGIEHRQIKTNGITLHVVEAGPKNGPLVLLLHGFPEFWYEWRAQIGPLVEAGYHVVAPDQRGYNLSDKPRGVDAYNIDQMAADAVGLIDALGEKQASIVGHDWGGSVTWWAAIRYPERVKKIVVMAVPPLHVLAQALRHDLAQLRRSWYMFFFQLPVLPEAMIRANDFKASKDSMLQTSRPGTFSAEELAQYTQSWEQPGAITGMVNWYRAGARTQPARPPASLRVKPPALLIWGKLDQFIGERYAHESIDLCENGRLELIDNAGHWMLHEEPERVNKLMLDFLR